MQIRTIILTSLLIASLKGKAQPRAIDSLRNQINLTKNDTTKMVLLNILADNFAELNPDSSLFYSEKAIVLASRLKFGLEEIQALGTKGYAFTNRGNYPRALQTLLAGIAVANDPSVEKNVLSDKFPDNDEYASRKMTAHDQRICRLGRIYQHIGVLYANAHNYNKEVEYYLVALDLIDPLANRPLQSILNGALGRAYLSLKKTDSALYRLQLAYKYVDQIGYERYRGSIFFNLARVYLALGNEPLAIANYKKSIVASKNANYLRGTVASSLGLSSLYLRLGLRDSSFYYAMKGFTTAKLSNTPTLIQRSDTTLAAYYRSVKRYDSAVKYQDLFIQLNDSIFNVQRIQQFQNIAFDEQQRVQQIESAKEAYRNKLSIYSLTAGIAVVLFIAVVLLRTNQQRQRAKLKIEKAYEQLKATQSQLVHSEKMASLGELTAGIAHEIQNPLNFVNNFSEVSQELITEMNDEIAKGNFGEAKEISNSLLENLKKINHHGKRADSIVKGMLQHSRTSAGQKEFTDINALCDEYLRLAYHGLRAKDKSFNAKFETDFDSSLPQIKVAPQELGRVVLNLINNAFYATNEKNKLQSPESNFQPLVIVSTKNLGDGIQITVRDNGMGVPEKIKDKIFQPFFTTKPSGQGTGLGLSLAFDIISHGHGGEIRVDAVEGQGSVFTILLPIEQVNKIQPVSSST